MALIPVVSRLTSGPLNYCIYCGATGVTLTDEHIVPEGMNGKYELLRACCVPCQKIIHVFETDLMKHAFQPIRRALGLRGSKTKKGAPIKLRLNKSERRITVPVSEFPIYLPVPIFLFGPPGLVTNRRRDYWPLCDYKFVFANGKSYFDAKLAALGLRFADISKLPNSREFCRFLAKVAHSYAVARAFEGAVPPFQPYLRKFILGKTPLQGGTLIGNSLDQLVASVKGDPGSMTLLFEIPQNNRRYLAAEIRLFGTATNWRYVVIVGRIIE
jgi:hypothetical protein